MEPRKFACTLCDGSGKTMQAQAATVLTSATPVMISVSCHSCHGTGVGVSVPLDDAEAYKSRPIESSVDLFQFAKEVANELHDQRNTDTGFWVLSVITSKSTCEGDARERGSSTVEEVYHYQSALCLTNDGGFTWLDRSKEEVVWAHGRWEDMGWSIWEPRRLSNIDEFLIEFDYEFRASAPFENGRYSQTEKCNELPYYRSSGLYADLRKIYQKGVGLEIALADLRSNK